MNSMKLPAWILGVALASPLLLCAAEGDAAKGKAVFDSKCALCHYPDKTDKKMGPGLKGLFKKEKLANGSKPTVESVTKVINEGGNGMPPYKDLLSAGDRADLLRYLQTL